MDRAKHAVAAFAPAAGMHENQLKKPDAEGYWTYIPPEKSKEAALIEIGKLDSKGIKDHFLIQESGKWQYAISLGIFKTAESAKKYEALLKRKGISSALSGKRDTGQSELLIENLPDSAAAQFRKLDFGDAKLESVDCNSIRGKASRD